MTEGEDRLARMGVAEHTNYLIELVEACLTNCTPCSAREPERWIAKALGWRDAAFRRTVRGLLWRESDPTRQRLGRGDRLPTRRRWDDPVQKVCDAHTEGLRPWQEIAQDKGR